MAAIHKSLSLLTFQQILVVQPIQRRELLIGSAIRLALLIVLGLLAIRRLDLLVGQQHNLVMMVVIVMASINHILIVSVC
jgi:Mg/Co/Ni transporter MgtE